MPDTATWLLTYPASTGNVQLWLHLQALAEDVDAALTLLKSQVPKIVGRGERTSSGTATAGTEQPYMRVDNIPIVSGVAYKIWISPLTFDSTVAGDTIQVRLRANTAGVATIASTQLTLLCDDSKSASGFQKTKGMALLYIASTTGNLSLLISYIRVAGTGNVRLFAASDLPCQMVVETYGIAPPSDTGQDL